MFNNLESKITAETSKSDVKKLVLEDRDSFDAGITALTERIKNNEPKEQLLAELSEKYDNKYFLELITKVLTIKIAPYEEMQYFRSIDPDELFKTFKYLFENIIIRSELKETIITDTGLDAKNYGYAFKLLNTLSDWIIIRRYTYDRFCRQLYDMFGFEKKIAEMFWETYTERKDELITITMLNTFTMCKGMADSTSKLLKIFTDIFKDDEKTDENSQ